MKRNGSAGVALTPAQQSALDDLLQARSHLRVFVLGGAQGSGRTTVLRELHRRLGGAFLSTKAFIDAMGDQHPLRLEETFEALVLRSLERNDCVILDDFDILVQMFYGQAYPRAGYIAAVLTSLNAFAEAHGKTLVYGGFGHGPVHFYGAGHAAFIREFEPADYETACRAYLPNHVASGLDYRKIHRFASHLTMYQLRGTCEWLQHDPHLDTDRFIDFLRARQLASNVDLGEVLPVDLHSLKGLDDLIEALEANVILPLENDALATELALKPKRGVLLAGPPGTGKTTVGRALAHRLRSKFFLIDGTFISGTGGFYQRIQEVFKAAQENAPAIIFIDDSDVIFESGEETGLYRYLLTILDGLESKSSGQICLMMTAMNVANLPPALIRSGRIELWLETRLPDEQARKAILVDLLATLPAAYGQVDRSRIAQATEGFTGADLKRLIEDGKVLFAYDRANGRPMRETTEYFLSAVETVQANRQRYAMADAQARTQRPSRPAFFDPGMISPGMVQAHLGMPPRRRGGI